MNKIKREIKFRAWDNDKKLPQMYPVNKIDLKKDQVNLGDLWRKKLSDTPLMQFTGLKDKNGEEIYEGDIVKAKNGSFMEVGFFEGSFCLFEQSEPYPAEILNYSHSMWSPPGIEIVGNIYQNPEMLEGE